MKLRAVTKRKVKRPSQRSAKTLPFLAAISRRFIVNIYLYIIFYNIWDIS